MRYVRNRSHFSQKRSSSGKGKWILSGLVVAVVIVVAVFVFGGGEEEVVVEEEVVDEVVEETQDEVVIVDGTNWTQETTLSDVEGTGGSGTSRRGVSGDLFTHVVVADLPAIDPEVHFYEGWLVVPGVVEFFSTGTMFAREDGKWGLVWEVKLDDAPDYLFDYREVVITREPYDDDPAPSPEHVIEGTFDE